MAQIVDQYGRTVTIGGKNVTIVPTAGSVWRALQNTGAAYKTAFIGRDPVSIVPTAQYIREGVKAMQTPPTLAKKDRAMDRLSEISRDQQLTNQVAELKAAVKSAKQTQQMNATAKTTGQLAATPGLKGTVQIGYFVPGTARPVLTIDGRGTAPGRTLVAPGRHVITASIRGKPQQQKVVTIEAGKVVPVTFDFRA